MPRLPLLLPLSAPVSLIAGLMISRAGLALPAVALVCPCLASAHIPCDSAQQLIHRVVRGRFVPTILRNNSYYCWLLTCCRARRCAPRSSVAGKLSALVVQDLLGGQRLSLCFFPVDGRWIFMPSSHCVYHPSHRLHSRPTAADSVCKSARGPAYFMRSNYEFQVPVFIPPENPFSALAKRQPLPLPLWKEGRREERVTPTDVTR